MNYRHIYMLIIGRAESEEKLGLRKKGNGNYYEAHHILPKSLFPLWKKRSSNLVLLTAKEHYFCHELLVKIFPSKEMSCALWFLSNHKNYKVSLKQYERAKYLKYLSSLGKNNPNYGNKWTDDQKKKASENTKKQFELYGNPNKGNFWTDEQKQSLRIKKEGRHFYTNGTKDICVFDNEVPVGFWKGHSKSFSPKTEEGRERRRQASQKAKHINTTKGLKWFHDKKGHNILSKECPKGFLPGKYMSRESLENLKRKNSLAHKGKITKQNKVIELFSQKVFNSQKEAALYFGISPSYLSSLIKGSRKSNKYNFKILQNT